MQRFTSVIFVLMLGFTPYLRVYADAPQAQVMSSDFSYALHLYFAPQDSSLSVDTTSETPYDVLTVPFTQNTSLDGASYTGKVIAMNGETIIRFGIDPVSLAHGQTEQLQKIDVSAPFFADAKEIVLYHDEKKLTTVSVSGSSFCNDDKKCTADLGETKENCPLDCKGTRLLPEVNITPPSLPSGDNAYPNSGDTVSASNGFPSVEGGQVGTSSAPASDIQKYILLAALGVVLLFSLVLLLRRRSRKAEEVIG